MTLANSEIDSSKLYYCENLKLVYCICSSCSSHMLSMYIMEKPQEFNVNYGLN
jgi:hypothetical protein